MQNLLVRPKLVYRSSWQLDDGASTREDG